MYIYIMKDFHTKLADELQLIKTEFPKYSSG